MTVELEPVPIERKPVLRHLLELYAYDMSEYEGTDVNEHGLFGYKYPDLYWMEEGRYPFLIRVDGRLAGFVLVRQVEGVHIIAEFFVLRKYRRQGVTNHHRTLSTYLHAFLQAGFHLCDLLEPKPSPEQCARYPGVTGMLRVPLFVMYLLEKPI